MVVQLGEFIIGYDLIVEIECCFDLQLLGLCKMMVEELFDDVFQYLLLSCYVDSDFVSVEVWECFGNVQGGWVQVQVVCDYFFDICVYGYGFNLIIMVLQVFGSG